MRPNLISFDLLAGFGVFKKPDVNEGMQLTFNMMHKPALLGILGAIAGLGGYGERGVFPEFYQKLASLRVGIQPLFHDKGNFIKTVVKYTNTVGYANADGNLIITEQTLRLPAYRCFLLLDLEDQNQALLHKRILAGEAEYLPYFGKNECSAWWDSENVRTYTFEPFHAIEDFRIESLFIRNYPIREQRVKPTLSPSSGKLLHSSTFAFFERLPVDFYIGDKGKDLPEAEKLKSRSKPLSFVQYDLAEFAYTDWVLQKESIIYDLYQIKSENGETMIVQLF